jgi:hypothetical protein
MTNVSNVTTKHITLKIYFAGENIFRMPFFQSTHQRVFYSYTLCFTKGVQGKMKHFFKWDK